MIKAYNFVQTKHLLLHNYVVAFFDRIEHETVEFSLDFFEADFRPIVQRHRKLLKKAFKDIYIEIRQWGQADRSQLCLEVRQSNNIEQICTGTLTPKLIDDTATGVYEEIRSLFQNLYTDVLDGKPFRDQFGVTLRQHFDHFRRANNEITLCPMCGISELKTHHDSTRDQYDHYLPKSFYPLSSVNFYNLVPTCKECNSFDVKGDKNVILFRNSRLFYPYDQNHQGVDITFSIQQDNSNIDEISWQIDLASLDGKDQEINAWDQIFNIRERYLNFVKGRMKKWYKAYWEYFNDEDLQDLSDDQKRRVYFASLRANEAECLDVIKRPALSEFLENSPLARARQEAALYS
jgi:hypothetical protein